MSEALAERVEAQLARDVDPAARAFAARLAEHTGVPVSMADERLTSREAGEASHAAAAALIAETWLNAPD